MPNICFLCASDEGIFLDISEDKTFFNKIETCLSLKASKDDALSTKICHKCAYEVDKCYDFVHKYKDSRKELEKSLKKRKSNCFFCQEPARKGYFFNLKKTNQLNDAFDKIYYLFDELTDETDIFICLVCRYSIDLLFDLQTVSEEVSEKLHKIIDEGIKVDKLSKTKTTIVRRKTTRVRSPRIGLQTSDTESDTGIMARNSRKTANKVEKKMRNRFCDECQSETEKGVDMFRIHRTGRTVCKTCWITMDPEKITERNKRKRNSSDADIVSCKVFLKDVLRNSSKREVKPYRMVKRSNDDDKTSQISYKNTDGNSSSGNESRTSTKTKAQLKEIPDTRLPSKRIRNPSKRASTINISSDDEEKPKAKRSTATKKETKTKKEDEKVTEKPKVERQARIRKKSETVEVSTGKKSKNLQVTTKSKRDRSSSVESVASSVRSRSTRSVDVELPKRNSRKRNDSTTSVSSTASTQRRAQTTPVREFKSPQKVTKPPTKKSKVVNSKEKSEDEKFSCAACNTEFETRDIYSTHQKTHLKDFDIKLQRCAEKVIPSSESDEKSDDFVLQVKNSSDSDLKQTTVKKSKTTAKKRGKSKKFSKTSEESNEKEESEVGNSQEISSQQAENEDKNSEKGQEFVTENVDDKEEVPESLDAESAEKRKESEVEKEDETGNIDDQEKEDATAEVETNEETIEEKNSPKSRNRKSSAKVQSKKSKDNEELSADNSDVNKTPPRSRSPRKNKSPAKSSPVKESSKSPEKSLEKSPEKSAEESNDNSAEKSNEKSADELNEESAEKSNEKSADESNESNEKSPKRSNKKSPKKSPNKSPKKSPLKSESSAVDDQLIDNGDKLSRTEEESVGKELSNSEDLENRTEESTENRNKSLENTKDSVEINLENTESSLENKEQNLENTEESSENMERLRSDILENTEESLEMRKSLNNTENSEENTEESQEIRDLNRTEESLEKIEESLDNRKETEESTENRGEKDSLENTEESLESTKELPLESTKGLSLESTKELLFENPKELSADNSKESESSLKLAVEDVDNPKSDELTESKNETKDSKSMQKSPRRKLRRDSGKKGEQEEEEENIEDLLQGENLQVIDEIGESSSLEKIDEEKVTNEEKLDEESQDDFTVAYTGSSQESLEIPSLNSEDLEQSTLPTMKIDDDDETSEKKLPTPTRDENKNSEIDDITATQVFSEINPIINPDEEQSSSLPQEIEDVVQNGLEEIRENKENKAEDTVSEVLQECFDIATKEKEQEKNLFLPSQANLEDISSDALNGGDMPSLETDESEVSNL
ncbi:muscle M-line assembly protein unc-89-like [Leptopilina heterotoma]|uniref:muscle M-line assembly protein unc-89-like n=1 Tax=Leptopilina heterotoma TaxID=63436 RepID=UPI001CA9C170|nr:muscle M-line assembly protein unc-89-like [Leptopilina heterotoma]